jgi:hypothetical protein
MHSSVQGPSSQQIYPGSLEFASTRPAKYKTKASFLDEPMHLVEQTGKSLNFVNDYPLMGWNWAQFFGELAGICQKALIYLLGQQIDHMCVGVGGAKPCTLTGTARPHQKKALLRSFEYS